MTIQYDLWLVFASVAVAILASYAGLNLASRVAVSRARIASQLWLIGGAASMGIGIWSMHFVGMLAASLPISMVYNVGWTLLSLLIAVVISGFALYFVNRETLGWGRLAIGGSLMGIGIASMHYTGMAAIEVSPGVAYKPVLFLLSVVIAILASCVALWLSFNMRSAGPPVIKRCLSAAVMGAAIAGMHYTGMAAASFAPGSVCTVASENVDNFWLGATVTGFTIMMLAITLIVSLFDSHLISHAAHHAESLLQVNQRLKLETLELAAVNGQLQREIEDRIRERREFSDHILGLNAELEDRVQQRTAQLQSANRELESFAYSVSHDLRSPLNTVDGFSQLLSKHLRGKLDDKSLHYVDRIRAGTQQMGQLIDGMLTLAKHSRDLLKQESVDLSAMARKLGSEYKETAPERRAVIEVQGGLMTRGEPMLLHAVMQNLMGNAWKFTARKTETRIVVGSYTSTDGEMVFFVKDNGVGFDMAYANNLFKTFQRLHSEGDFSGTGVGLAIVNRIIGRHQGRVWVEAAQDQGASFYFVVGSGPATALAGRALGT